MNFVLELTNFAQEEMAAQAPLPIRLSYHNGNHYNSIDDLDHSNVRNRLIFHRKFIILNAKFIIFIYKRST